MALIKFDSLFFSINYICSNKFKQKVKKLRLLRKVMPWGVDGWVDGGEFSEYRDEQRFELINRG